jgi:hypothetical protein
MVKKKNNFKRFGKNHKSRLILPKVKGKIENEFEITEQASTVWDNKIYRQSPEKKTIVNTTIPPKKISSNFRPHARVTYEDVPPKQLPERTSLGLKTTGFFDADIIPIRKKLEFYTAYERENRINVPRNEVYKTHHTFTIIIPYKYDSRDNCIIYCLRSIEKYMRGNYNVILVGDAYDNMNEENLIFISLKSKLKHKELRTLEAKLTALNHPNCSDRILWVDDDIYFTEPVSIKDFMVPRTYDREITENPSTTWGQYKINTKKILVDRKLPVKSFEIHAPYYMQRNKFFELFDVFPEIYYVPILIEDLYYNYHNVRFRRYSTEWHTRFQFRVQNSKKKYTREEFNKLVEDCLFLNNDTGSFNGLVTEYLNNNFPNKSRFELCENNNDNSSSSSL